MSIINPQDFINLKAAVKAEMLRRKYQNSLESYGGTAYDYINVPAEGSAVYEEHYTKNITPLQAANSTKVPDAIMPRDISKTDLNAMEAYVEILSARTNLADSSSTDCNGNCAGACYTECSTGCSTTCTGTCTGGCSTTCTGGCTGSSTCSCGGNCSVVCTTGCRGCTGCGEECSYHCIGACSGYCTGCTGSCSGACTGCSGTCSGGCTGTSTSIYVEDVPDVEEGTEDKDL